MSTMLPANQFDVSLTVDAGQGVGNSATLADAWTKVGGRCRLFVWSASWGGTTARLQVIPTPDASAGAWTNLSSGITADSSEIVEIPKGCALRLNTSGGTGTGIRAVLIPIT